jgi:hypothetical protein
MLVYQRVIVTRQPKDYTHVQASAVEDGVLRRVLLHGLRNFISSRVAVMRRR